MTGIPIELISKYYARLYCFESDDEDLPNFYSDLNKDLRNNKTEKYLPYIKVLYEGVKLKALPLASNKKLYRGTLILNNEINQKKRTIYQVLLFFLSHFYHFPKVKMLPIDIWMIIIK